MALTKISTGMLKQDAASSDLNIDAGTLYIDVSNNRVGIANTSPSQALNITGNALATGWFRGSAGSATTPTFLVDGSTGMFRASSNDIGFSTAGSERMRIDSNGRVGIGTTSPGYPLEISAEGTVSLAYQRTGTGVTAKKWGFHSDNSNTYWQNITDSLLAITVSNAGNVGIGTTSPSQAFHVEGGNVLVKQSSTAGAVFLSNTYVGIKRSNAVDSSNARDIEVFTDGNGANVILSSNGAGSAEFVLDDSGRVGIGTTSPNALLDLTGVTASSSPVMRFTGTGNASAGDVIGQIEFYNSDTTDNTAGVMGKIRAIAGASGGEGSIQILTDMPSEGADAATVAAHFNGNGNVGIGEDSPAGPLHVTSTGNASIFEGTGGNVSLKLLRSDASGAVDFGDIQFANSTGIAAKINSRGEGGSASGNLTFQTRNTSGTLAERMRIQSGGNVGIGTASPAVGLHVYDASQGRVAIENASRRFDLTVDTDGLSFRDQSAALTRMVLDTSGNLTFNSEGQKLIFNTSSTAAHAEIYTGDTFGSNRLIIEGENGIHNVIDGNSNSVGDWSVYNERLAAHQIFLTGTNGYFGIGTTSPANPMHIVDTRNYSHSTTADSSTNMAGLRVTNSNNNSNWAGIWFATGSAAGSHWSGIAGARTNHASTWGTHLSFFTHEDATQNLTQATERMRIDSSGNLLVGTTSSNGTANKVFQIKGSNSTGLGTEILIHNSGQGADAKSALTFGNKQSGVEGYTGVIYTTNNDGLHFGATTATNAFTSIPTATMALDTNGRLGIGNTSPGETLHIGSGQSNYIRIHNAASGDVASGITITRGDSTGFALYDNPADDTTTFNAIGKMNFRTDGSSYRLYISDNGRVGINTNSLGADGLTVGTAPNGNCEFDLNNTGTNGTRWRFNSSAAGAFQIENKTDSTIPFVILDNGRVGVGSTSPDRRLVVSQTNPGDNNTAAKITGSTSYVSDGNWEGPLELGWTQSSNDGYIRMLNIHLNDAGSNNQQNYGLFVSGVDLNYLDAPLTVGNNDVRGVGGTPTDVNQVEVGPGYINLSRDDTAGAAQIQFGKNGVLAGSIVTGTSTTYNTTSDRRAKENISDAQEAGELIDSIRVRKFDWKSTGEHQRYGMIAQELLEVAPEVVHQPENEEQMMGVDYSKLVPLLLKEVQSLRARVAQLEGDE